MPFKMIKKHIGIADPKGVTTKEYQQDEIIEENEDWKKKLGEGFTQDIKSILYFL